MRTFYMVIAVSWVGLWWTPDQQGQRLARDGEFAEAAQTFADPFRQGVAWYRAGEFEKAIAAFTRVSSAESHYNQGNAWVLLGKYDTAIESYEQALKLRPDWQQARENRDLAAARGERVKSEGGDLGDQKIGADEVVFDKNKQQSGQDTEVAGDQAVTDASVQSIWLRQVQTKPADFLKAKFRFQHAQQTAGGDR